MILHKIVFIAHAQGHISKVKVTMHFVKKKIGGHYDFNV